MKRRSMSIILGAWLVGAVMTAWAAGGSKQTAEACNDDNECSRGHCYKKQDGNKVCVDCSPSEISDYRGQVQRYCKDEPTGCTSIPQGEEVSENYFKVRIENGERCIRARSDENSRCWGGGDQGHKDAVDGAQRAKKNCYDEQNTRKGNGGIYTCSDSTYQDRSNAVNSTCSADGNACLEFKKDDAVVDCSKIEDAIKATDKCVDAIQRLQSDCLPRLARKRENQFSDAKTKYDTCKDVLGYKKDKKLCK